MFRYQDAVRSRSAANAKTSRRGRPITIDVVTSTLTRPASREGGVGLAARLDDPLQPRHDQRPREAHAPEVVLRLVVGKTIVAEDDLGAVLARAEQPRHLGSLPVGEPAQTVPHDLRRWFQTAHTDRQSNGSFGEPE